MINETLSPAQAVALLNELCAIDPKGMRGLFSFAMGVRGEMEDHPTVQTGFIDIPTQGILYAQPSVGFLGILNGMFGTFDDGPKKGWGPITLHIDPSDPESISFSLTDPSTVPIPYAG